ncbi:hypothetical protein cyc_04074 [Cyclospora cayetanensis]|uniref:Uncharacterized protein n=1 Tax=Cyclospora cayetanensis TaxID=88456 RepID=A0A1D3D594_9EIME|nr:hypothetical protein cyc_04074 [Cyclospora cayetanensis]
MGFSDRLYELLDELTGRGSQFAESRCPVWPGLAAYTHHETFGKGAFTALEDSSQAKVSRIVRFRIGVENLLR